MSLPTDHEALLDPARLAAVAASGLLDTPPEDAFDRVTRLATRVTGAPAAMLTLVTGDRQYFKSTHGVPTRLSRLRGTPLSQSLCGETVRSGRPLRLDDARNDPTYRAHPAVTELGVAAYVGVPLTDAGGNVLGSLCVLDFDDARAWPARALDDLADLASTVTSEITARQQLAERTRVDEALRASERRFRELVEAAHEGIWSLDPVGVTRYVNPRMASLLGYEPDSMLGHAFFDFMDPRAAFEARTLFARRQRGIAESCELAFARRDGGELCALVSMSSVYASDGELAGVIAHVSDITERKRAEEQLRRREEQYRLVTEGVPVLIAYGDARARLQFVNRAYAAAFGQPAEAFLDRPLREVIGPEAYALAQPYVDAVLDGQQSTFEMDVPMGGRARHVSVTYVPHRTADGQVAGFFAIITDVTERRSLEEQLRQAQKMEAVGRLAGGVAHDFNNLLTVITASTMFVREEIPAGSPAREDLAAVDAAAARAAALTRQLLAFSRQQVLTPRHLRVNDVVTDVEAILRRVIGADVALVTRLDPDLHPIHADAGQLEQVLMNLAVNARDAMPEGGTLTIETRNVAVVAEAGPRGAPLAGDGLAPGDYAAILVRDSGAGMDEATKARVFEPFFTTKEPGKGTGLGLATVYGIVRQSGGAVRVESTPGAGTTFSIYLPRRDDEGDALPVATTARPTPRGAGTVLLVEDEAPVRGAVRRMLTRGGYAVLEAANGAAALDIAARHNGPIDVVLTDVVMPEMGASALVGRLRAHRPGVPVLLMSGYSEDAVAGRGGLGASALLSKPFTIEQLLRAVREAVEGHAAAPPPGFHR